MSIRWTWDGDVQALYVYVSDMAPASQLMLNDQVIADIDETGQLVGLEVLGTRAVVPVQEIAQLGIDPADLDILVGVLVLGPARVATLDADIAAVLKANNQRTRSTSEPVLVA